MEALPSRVWWGYNQEAGLKRALPECAISQRRKWSAEQNQLRCALTVSVCQKVSTIEHFPFPITSWYHSHASGLIGSPTVPSTCSEDRLYLVIKANLFAGLVTPAQCIDVNFARFHYFAKERGCVLTQVKILREARQKQQRLFQAYARISALTKQVFWFVHSFAAIPQAMMPVLRSLVDVNCSASFRSPFNSKQSPHLLFYFFLWFYPRVAQIQGPHYRS